MRAAANEKFASPEYFGKGGAYDAHKDNGGINRGENEYGDDQHSVSCF